MELTCHLAGITQSETCCDGETMGQGLVWGVRVWMEKHGQRGQGQGRRVQRKHPPQPKGSQKTFWEKGTSEVRPKG